MSQKRYLLTAGATAVLMLLGACGSDTDDGTRPGTQARNERGAIAIQKQTGEVDPKTTPPAQNPDSTTPGIEGGMVSGELLASLMITNTHPAGLTATQSTGPYTRSAEAPVSVVPPLLYEHRIKRQHYEVGDLRIRAYADSKQLSEYSLGFDGRVDYQGNILPIIVATKPEFNISYRPPFSFRGFENDPAGTELLRIRPEISAFVGINQSPPWQSGKPPADHSNKKNEFSGKLKHPDNKPFVIRKGDRFPFNTVLHSWHGTEGSKVELFLLKGNKPDELLSCLNNHLPISSRLICTVWHVPSSWEFGEKDNSGVIGAYIVDDRDRFGGKPGGKIYWLTSVLNVGKPKLPQSAPTGTASAPVSFRGISGDLLATMLSHPRQKTLAQPASAPAPWGKIIRDSGRPAVMDDIDYNPGRGALVSSLPSYRQATRPDGDKMAYQRQGLDFLITPYQQKNDGYRINFDTSKPIAAQAPLMNLTHNARLQWGITPDNTYIDYYGGDNNNAVFYPVKAFTVRKDGLVRFNQVLQRWWAPGGHFIDLMVLRGAKSDQARLCTRTKVPGLERLTCNNWQVPAGWQFGQPLIGRGLSVVDNRSGYPGETGYLFWQTAH